MLLAFIAGAVACGEDVDQPNQPATIEGVGPIEATGEQVSIFYEIQDREGDDQGVTIRICEVGQPERCGFPVQGTGGDGTRFVPTVPADQPVTHLFRWRVGCGRFVEVDNGDEVERVDTELQTQYVARVSITGSEDVSESDPFTLQELTMNRVPACNN